MNAHADCHGCCCSRATRSVLLIDDDEDFIYQQKVQLEGAGFTVHTADGEAQAKELLAQHRFDVVVVDLMMEHMDTGFSLCYHMKKINPTMPVIMVSSVNGDTRLQFDVSTDRERSWIKADAFLTKPIRFEQLKMQIDRLLK